MHCKMAAMFETMFVQLTSITPALLCVRHVRTLTNFLVTYQLTKPGSSMSRVERKPRNCLTFAEHKSTTEGFLFADAEKIGQCSPGTNQETWLGGVRCYL